MKKRITLISVLSALVLTCCCAGILSVFLQKDTAYASEIAFLSDTEESDCETQNFVAGEQIELYLGVRDKTIPNEIKENGKVIDREVTYNEYLGIE